MKKISKISKIELENKISNNIQEINNFIENYGSKSLYPFK